MFKVLTVVFLWYLLKGSYIVKYLYMRASTNETKQSLARQEKFGRDNNIPESNWFREYASGSKNDRIELNRLLSFLI